MAHNQHDRENPNFEITSKRRKGFPSETRVKRGRRIVHGDKELQEKLGRNDLCPCGSGHSFQELLPAIRPF
jgi:SEC-C motif